MTIRQQVIEDLILNVLFGRLGAVDVALFLQGTGIPGLLLASLEAIAVHGFFNFPALAAQVGEVKPSTLRPRVQSLVAAGMLSQAKRASYYRITPRARVFLQVCHLLERTDSVGPELSYVLNVLGLGSTSVVDVPDTLDQEISLGNGPEDSRARLIFEARAAKQQFGASLRGVGYPQPSEPDGPVSNGSADERNRSCTTYRVNAQSVGRSESTSSTAHPCGFILSETYVCWEPDAGARRGPLAHD